MPTNLPLKNGTRPPSAKSKSAVVGSKFLSVIVLPFTSLILTNLFANNSIWSLPSNCETDDATFGPKYFCTNSNGSPSAPPPPSVINFKSSNSITDDSVGPPGNSGSSKSLIVFKKSLALPLATGWAFFDTPAIS